MPSLIGNKPNQVPSNGDLGTLAFEDKVNYNTNKTSNVIEVTDNTNAALRVTQLGTGNALLIEDSANPDSTPIVVDASGRLVVGNTTTYATVAATTAITPNFQNHGSTLSTSAIGQFAWSSTTPYYTFNKSNGAVGVYTAVADGDALGRIQFNGADGSAFVGGAIISSTVDGTVTTGNIPSRLAFFTAPTTGTLTERMRITSAGVVELTSGQLKFPATQSASSDANTLDDYEEGTWTPSLSPNGGSLTSFTASGKYTKIGRQVTVWCTFTITNGGTASGRVLVSGLPFTSASGGAAASSFVARENSTTGTFYGGNVNENAASASIWTFTNGGIAWNNGYQYDFLAVYQV